MVAVPLVAEPELTKTMRPPRSLFRKYGRPACTAVIREKKLTSKCAFHPSMGTSSTFPKGVKIPAFRMRASRCPYVFTAESTAEVTISLFVLNTRD